MTESAYYILKRSITRLLIGLCFALFSCKSHEQDENANIYVASVKIRYFELSGVEREQVDENEKDVQLFEQTFLKLKKDSAFFDRQVVMVKKGDTLLLENDGIAHYYKGTYTYRNDSILFNLHEVIVNHFETLLEKGEDGIYRPSQEPELLAGIINNGKIVMERVRLDEDYNQVIEYMEVEKKSIAKTLISEKPSLRN